jgi:hypothetical protein
MTNDAMKRFTSFFPALLCMAILASAASPVLAASEEIQVYMDEMNGAGKFGLDIHANYVFSGTGQADYAGAQAPLHVFRVTPEFSYGLSDHWDLGGYVLSSLDRNNKGGIDGGKLRLKYIAPKAQEQNYFWGANLEIGRVAYRLDENPWNGELKGIFGVRHGAWTFATNPNLGFKISGPAASPPSVSVNTRIAYKAEGDIEYGIESYNELGPARRLGNLNQQSQTLFGVVDINLKGWDLNLGIGRGLTPASDRWLAKVIIGVPFDAR